MAQSGLSALLCGYGLRRSTVEPLPPRVLLGAIRVANLHLDPEVLRRRLRSRPGYDEERIERKALAAEGLREEADENIDVSCLSEEGTASEVRRWLACELNRPQV